MLVVSLIEIHCLVLCYKIIQILTVQTLKNLFKRACLKKRCIIKNCKNGYRYN